MMAFEATPTTGYNTARRDAGCQDLLTLREGFTSSEYELYLEIFGRFDSKNGLQRLANSELHRMGERFTKFRDFHQIQRFRASIQRPHLHTT